nr:MAG TPA: hypothetical protein [Caudoviricetes sp.]
MKDVGKQKKRSPYTLFTDGFTPRSKNLTYKSDRPISNLIGIKNTHLGG